MGKAEKQIDKSLKGLFMNLRKILSLALTFQLVVGPMTAQAASGSELFNSAVNVATSIMGSGSYSNPYHAQDAAFLNRMQTPESDKYFNASTAAKIPGLQEYLNSIGKPNAMVCSTLRTSLDEIKSDVCSLGVMNNKGYPDAQLSEMDYYSDQYNSIRKLYENYQLDSNSEKSQQFGTGCMNNAMQILNGFFAYRLNKMNDNLLAIENANKAFIEKSKEDLNAIAEDAAVLDGGDSTLANEAKQRRPDLFDYAKRFNNQACKSMMSSDDIGTKGTSSGLNGINNNLKTIYDTPSGKYRGSSFSNAYPTVVADLQSLANSAATQAKLKFSSVLDGTFYSGLAGSVSSSEGSNTLLKADLFSDVQMKVNESGAKIKASLSTVSNELGSNGGNAVSMAMDLNATSFDSEIANVERNIKNSCLNSNGGSIETALSKIYSPTSSSFANKNAPNFYKNKLKSIMENTTTDFSKKLADIESVQSSEGSDFIMKMQNSYDVTTCSNGVMSTKKVSGNSNITAATYFSDLMNNCECQFKYNKLNSSMTGAGAIAALKKANSDYKNLAASSAQAIKDQITKKLITCDSSLKASASTVGSCTPESFNTTTAGFCAANALSCSTNMKNCTQQAAAAVKEIKADRTKRVNNYKQNVDAYKAQTAAIFKSVMDQYRLEATVLQRNFGLNWETPTGIKTKVDDNSKYLSDFQELTAKSDDKLLLEDPAAVLDMYKSNIELLKKSVQTQQDQLTGSSGILAKYIAQTKANYKTVAKDADKFYSDCANASKQFKTARNEQINQQNAEMTKKNQELGEQKSEVCSLYQTAQQSPQVACDSQISDTMSAVKSAYLNLQSWCRNNGISTNNNGTATDDAIAICKPLIKAKDTKTDIGKKCHQLANNNFPDTASADAPFKCERQETVSESGTKTYSKANCKEDLMTSIQLSYDPSTNSNTGNTEGPEVPAFCSADNSERNVIDMMGSAFQSTQQNNSGLQH
jgi:hypothetical protein